jgi:hypothetical protein
MFRIRIPNILQLWSVRFCNTKIVLSRVGYFTFISFYFVENLTLVVLIAAEITADQVCNLVELPIPLVRILKIHRELFTKVV